MDAEAVREFYDERYRGDYMARHPELERVRVRDVLGSEWRDAERVLDYGCGSGAWIPVLEDAFPTARLYGVEVSGEAVAAARQASGRVEVVQFDGDRAPFDDGSFDVVFSYHVLEHVLDLEATVSDMARLTGPGGRVVACLPCANRRSLMERAVRLTRDGVERSATGEARFFFEDPGHLRSVTSSELERLFAAHGMELVSAAFTGPLADLEYLSLRRHRIVELVDPARAKTPGARAKLGLARWVLLLAEAAVRAYRAPLRGVAGRSMLRTVAVGLAKLLATPVGVLILDVLPRWEWERRRDRPGGAAQYLVFKPSGCR